MNRQQKITLSITGVTYISITYATTLRNCNVKLKNIYLDEPLRKVENYSASTEAPIEIPSIELTENTKKVFIETNTKPSNIEIGYIN